MMRALTSSRAVQWLASAVLCLGVISSAISQEGKGDVVYVPTPQVVVESMLNMAKLGPHDYLIDLGSGDGRMVVTAARQFGARALGVDLDQQLLQLARETARLRGVAASGCGVGATTTGSGVGTGASVSTRGTSTISSGAASMGGSGGGGGASITSSN